MTTRGARLAALGLLAIAAVLIAYATLIAFSSSWRLAVVVFVLAAILGVIATIFLVGASWRESRARRRRDGR